MRDTHGSSWEDWGKVDPLWAILTAEGRNDGRWDVDEFFASGQSTIDALWQVARALDLPKVPGSGLDFGCGVGRLTRALGGHLEQVLGLDISPTMVTLARRYNAAYENLRFSVHADDSLAGYQDGTFDVICSLLVLQHLPSHEAIRGYVTELARVLAPGGVLMLQLPDFVPSVPVQTGWRAHLRPRTRLAHALKRLGVPPKILYDHFSWTPQMTMRAISQAEVQALVVAAGGSVAWTSEQVTDASGVRNLTYLISR